MRENEAVKIIIIRTKTLDKKTPQYSVTLASGNKAPEWCDELLKAEMGEIDGHGLVIVECDVSLLPIVASERSLILIPPIPPGQSFQRLLSSALIAGKGAPVGVPSSEG